MGNGYDRGMRCVLAFSIFLGGCGAARPAPLPSPGPVATVAVTTPPPSVTPPPLPAEKAVSGPTDAIAAFRRAWDEGVLPAAVTDGGRRQAFVESKTTLVREAPEPTAELVPCRAALARVNDTLGGSERVDLVLFGRIDALDRDGDCWQVGFAELFNQVVGYVDPGSGGLLMAWFVPEG
jgi:hypothetical protein